MTGQSILTDFLVLMDKNADDSDYRALALKWLNLVLDDIQNRQEGFHWKFLEKLGGTFNTAADDFDYALATIASDLDTDKIIAVYDKTYDRAYTYHPYEQFRRLIAADETNESGEPRIWSIFGGQLLLWPVPDAVVSTSIDYVKVITAATDAATALLVPDKYKAVILDGMLEWGFKFDPEMGNPVTQRQIYEDGIRRMKENNSSLEGDIPETRSHRDRYGRRGDVDGRNSLLFPLEQ